MQQLYQSNIKKLEEFLKSRGAEILTPTNQYEVIRFVGNGTIGIVYTGKKGFSLVGEAQVAVDAFLNKTPYSAAVKNRGVLYYKSIKVRALAERDGDKCFYCHKPLGDDITVEHLLSRNCGGSNHINNLALSHQACNLRAHHLPVVKKVQLRESWMEGFSHAFREV